MLRKWFSLALVALLMFSLMACTDEVTPPQNGDPSAEGYALSGPVTIELWHPITNPDHVVVLDALVAEFNAGIGAQLGITVNAVLQGSTGELATNVTAAIKAGNAPDVTMVNRIHVADFLQTDYVVDLNPYINDPDVGISDIDDMFPMLRAGGDSYSKEGMFSLPIHSFTELLYYNVGFFNEHNLKVPTTWDEVEAVSRQITAITGKPGFGWDNLTSSFIDLLLQHGGQFTTAQGELLFVDDPVSLEVMQRWQNNANEGIWRTAGEDMFFSGPFANEVVQMYVGDSVEASYISSKNPDLNWSVAPLPQADAANPAAISGGHVIIALNTTANADREYAAYEFIKFMTSTAANLAVVKATGYLPIRQSVVDDPTYQAYIAESGGKGDAQGAGVDQSNAYMFEPVYSTGALTSSAVNAAVRLMMQQVIESGVDPASAIADLVSSVG